MVDWHLTILRLPGYETNVCIHFVFQSIITAIIISRPSNHSLVYEDMSCV